MVSRFEYPDTGAEGLQGVTPQCLNCIWRNQDDSGKCRAFPDGIPMTIRLNEFDHRKPFPGDHELTFIPIKPEIGHPLGPLDTDPEASYVNENS